MIVKCGKLQMALAAGRLPPFYYFLQLCSLERTQSHTSTLAEFINVHDDRNGSNSNGNVCPLPHRPPELELHDRVSTPLLSIFCLFCTRVCLCVAVCVCADGNFLIPR